MPSSPGISTSSRATSGRCSRDRRDAPRRRTRPRRRPRGRARGRAAPTARRGPAPGRRRAAAGSVAPLIRQADAQRVPMGCSTRVVTPCRPRRPPARAARLQPVPAPHRGVARPDAVVDDLHGVRAAAAPSQRRGAAVPDHVGDALAHVQANSSRRSTGHVVGGVGQLGLDLGRRQRRSRPGELAGQGQLAVALHGAAYVGQRVARASRSRSTSSARARSGSTSSSRLRQLGLDGDDGERVAEDVVQVAREPGALVLDGEARRSPRGPETRSMLRSII